jgi:hypothetical protein
MNDYTVTVELDYTSITIESGQIDNVNTIEIDRYGNPQVIVNSQYPSVSLTDLPPGYPIGNTTGLLGYTRVSGLADYIQTFIPANSSIQIDGGSP